MVLLPPGGAEKGEAGEPSRVLTPAAQWLGQAGQVEGAPSGGRGDAARPQPTGQGCWERPGPPFGGGQVWGGKSAAVDIRSQTLSRSSRS